MGTETATTLDLEDVTYVSDGVDMETKVRSWDQELFDLVAANADVIIICPWQNNAEVALSTAMYSIPIEFIPENLSLLIAEVHQLLANSVVKVEEEIKVEAPKVESAKVKEVIAVRAGKPEKSEPIIKEVVSVAAPDAEPLVAITEINQVSAVPQEQIRIVSNEPQILEEAVQDVAQPYAQQIVEVIKPELGLPIVEIPKTKIVAELAPTVDVAQEISKKVEHEETERLIQEILLEIAPKTDEQDPVVGLEITEEASAPRVENLSTIQTNTDFVEEVKDVEQAPAILASEEVEVAEEIQTTLSDIVERIKDCEPEIAGKVHEILDKIIELPASDEIEVQEELEELIVELLDALDIEQTPELVKSLTTIFAQLEIEITEDEEEPQAKTTHDAIIKQLAGLKDLKKAIAHAYAIGKSAVSLYRLNYSM